MTTEDAVLLFLIIVMSLLTFYTGYLHGAKKRRKS